MIVVPEQLLVSLRGVPGFDESVFNELHANGEQVTSIRFNPKKAGSSVKDACFEGIDMSPVPWTEFGYYLSTRPLFTADPFFHAGCYYVQEASSMFVEQALKQLLNLEQPVKILDLCAAPGGKTTHIQSLISKDSLLVSNEVIKSRASVLRENIIKFGADNVVVTNNDPSDFSRLPGFFDVLLIDAPCSGSGLFHRDEDAIEEWSTQQVQLCYKRQQRILADAWPTLRDGGLLIYATCSYSKEEDEQVIDWMLSNLALETCDLTIEEDWNIVPVKTEKGGSGYRFWPYLLKGEGFFLCCFRKMSKQVDVSYRKNLQPLQIANRQEQASIVSWVDCRLHKLIKKNDLFFAIPDTVIDDLQILLTSLRVQYSGILIGELFNKDFVPSHPLAMSTLVSNTIASIELDYRDAIKFLQRKEFQVSLNEKGWKLVRYKDINLGWIKALGNRVNNYYPKQLRILKDL